jgi:hypothetical protein
MAVGRLADAAFLVPVINSGFRRHPIFHREQRFLADEQLSRFESAQIIDLKEVEVLLRARKRQILDQRLPVAVARYLDAIGGGDDKTELFELLDRVRAELSRSALEGREALEFRYLDLRYWSGLPVREIGRELGYSREHLTRSINDPAVELFRRYLLKQLK